MDWPNAGFDASMRGPTRHCLAGVQGDHVSFDLVFDEQHLTMVSSTSANALALMLSKQKKGFRALLALIVSIV